MLGVHEAKNDNRYDKQILKMYSENGTIEIEALTYIRGRSISNAYIIIDEAQNLTAHELKTIITRISPRTSTACVHLFIPYIIFIA